MKPYTKIACCVLLLFLFLASIAIPVFSLPSTYFVNQEFSNLSFTCSKTQDAYVYDLSFNVNNFSNEIKEYEIQLEFSDSQRNEFETFSIEAFELSQAENKLFKLSLECNKSYDTLTLLTIENHSKIKQCSFKIQDDSNTIITILYVLSILLFIASIICMLYKNKIKRTWIKILFASIMLAFFVICITISLYENSLISTIIGLSTFALPSIYEIFDPKFYPNKQKYR